MATETVTVYQDDDKQYRWTRKNNGNHEVVGASSEAYHNFSDAVENAKHINGDIGKTHDGTELQYIFNRP